jgi:hypothetical protein
MPLTAPTREPDGMSTQHKIHQEQQYLAALNQHDMGIIEQLYSKTATIEDPVVADGRVCSMHALRGPENMKSQ